MADDETQAANDAIRSEAAAAREAKRETGPDEPEKKSEDKPKVPDDIERIAAEADKPDTVKRALQFERENTDKAKAEAEQLRKQLKQHEDAKKSDQEKLEERATTAEKDAGDWRDKYLRLKIGTEKGLPTTLAERLRGDDEKAMGEDADRLLEQFPQSGRKPPAGAADGGKGEADEPDFNAAIRAKVRGR